MLGDCRRDRAGVVKYINLCSTWSVHDDNDHDNSTNDNDNDHDNSTNDNIYHDNDDVLVYNHGTLEVEPRNADNRNGYVQRF